MRTAETNAGHARAQCRLCAHRRILDDETVRRGDTKQLRRLQIDRWVGLRHGQLRSRLDHIKFVRDAKRLRHMRDGLMRAGTRNCRANAARAQCIRRRNEFECPCNRYKFLRTQELTHEVVLLRNNARHVIGSIVLLLDILEHRFVARSTVGHQQCLIRRDPIARKQDGLHLHVYDLAVDDHTVHIVDQRFHQLSLPPMCVYGRPQSCGEKPATPDCSPPA